jgi:hypothetical protein
MCVNLDCLSIDPADYFAWSRQHADGAVAGRKLFPKRPVGYARAARDLAAYAGNKGNAMVHRANGRIELAQRYEGICDVLYASLPPYARW